jgi:regulator of sirC expression with transglutaminase-like and TPR domain
MLMSAARERFAALVTRGDEHIDLAEAALLIAQEAYPSLDVATYLGRLDELATAARARVLAATTAVEQIARLNHFLFVERGFEGNRDNYYDPRNSFLNDVLDRRTGIPITLGLVYSEVAQRLGLPVCGVSFPGHFLVKYAGEVDVIVDAYFGTVIGLDECARRLREVYGNKARLDAQHLRPATAREILVRLLSNLKQIYVNKNEFVQALGCVDRILLLTPEEPRELRDRGILYQRLECFAPALRDLERYLQLAPDDETAPLIREILPDLHRQVAQLQ